MISEAVTFILARHGETQENAARRVQGQLPGSLSEKGRRQAEAVGSALASRNIHAAYSSDLARAWESAKIITGALPLVTVEPEPRLRERHLGRYQGGPLVSLFRRLKEEGVDLASFNPEGGEPSAVFKDRVREVVIELAGRHAGQTVLLVTHHGFIQMFMGIFAGRISRKQIELATRSGNISFAVFRKAAVRMLTIMNCQERTTDGREVQNN